MEASFEDIARDLAIAAGLVALGWAAFVFLPKLRGRTSAFAPRRNRPTAVLARLERSLAAIGFPRSAGETLREWARRVDGADPPPPWRAAMRELVEAYYRVRFDPLSAPAEGERFIAAAEAFRRDLVTGRA